MTTTARRPHRRRRTPWAAALAVAALACGLTACGSSTSSSSDAAASRGSSVSGALVPAAAPDNGLAQSVDRSTARTAPGAAATDPTSPEIISTGDVALRTSDVVRTRASIQQVVDRYQGHVAEDTTAADDSGTLVHSREVLRIPSAHFQDALSSIEGTAQLIDSSSQSQDVTTEVIDNTARLQTQRASIDRIRTLLARAGSVHTIVSIESELSDREATLDSLEQRQAYLSDQTAMSTLTVTVARTPEHHAAAPAAHHRHGFVGGLHAGWSGFTATLTGLAAAAGALLPFAALATVIGVPLWLVVRRRRRVPTAAVEPATAE